MEELLQQVQETARSMWRRRWIGLALAWLLAIVGAVGLMAIPNRFEAGARVYVDTKSVLRPLLRDLTVEPDLDQTIGLLARTLITRPNIELLIRRSGVDLDGMPPQARDVAIERLMRDINVAGSGRDNIFTFSYRDTDPERARLLVQNLVNLFLESDTGAKLRDAESARGFIDEQIKNYETRLAESENRLKDFKLKNLGVADTGGKDYFARIASLTDELSKATVELRAAEQSRDALRRELNGEVMTLVPETPIVTAPMTTEFDARIESLRRQLDDQLRRYTDQHPDVIATQRLIAGLEADRQKELEAKRAAAARQAAAAKTSAPTNPVMQQVKLALAEAEGKVASMRVHVGDLQSRLGTLRASASRVPQVEAELVQLNRDYEIIRKTYETMVARREKASLSEDMDATRSAQFRVIDPPRTAPQPAFPNRKALAPVVLLLAIVGGIAGCFLAVRLMPTFGNARTLRVATQRPVLGSVSMLVDPNAVRRIRRSHIAFGSASTGLLLVGAAWIVWIAMQVRQ